MAAFSYQHPFFIDSVSPSPTGLFMEEPAGTTSFPQFYPPEFYLQYGGLVDSAGLPQNYGFSNECSIDDEGEEAEASVVTRKQSTSSTTESGEQVSQFKSTSTPPPPAAAMDLHTKKRKKITIFSNAHSKQEAGARSNKKAKKSCDVEVGEETKKKQGKTGEEVKQSKKAQVQQRKKGADRDKEVPPTGYIHVRARRGQATDSHSLAERARREKISERMKLLQHLVPGCDKVTGKALMLDEIINYIQSLQSQVEFLSMKLASVNPLFYEFGLDLDGLLVRPESQRLSSNNNNAVVASPPPLPSPGQQCNPTTTTVHQQPHTAAGSSITCAAVFPAGQRQGDHFPHQSQDNIGGNDNNLLWDMEVEVAGQKLVNQSGFGIGIGIGSTTTTTNNNNVNFGSFH